MSAFVPQAGIGPVSIVSRSTNKLDVFAVGLDGRVYTAAWQPGDTEWRGWWRIDGVEAAPCAPVSAVSRSADKLDIFVAGLDGHVYTRRGRRGTHVLELDNDWSSKDDCYLHSYRVPDPERL